MLIRKCIGVRSHLCVYGITQNQEIMKNVIIAVVLLFCTAVSVSAQQNKSAPCSLDDFAKAVFGEKASFSPSDLLNSIKVYDDTMIHVTGTLLKDFAALKDTIESENTEGVMGLWGGLKVEANDIVVIDDNSKFTYGNPDGRGVYDDKFIKKTGFKKDSEYTGNSQFKHIYRFSDKATVYFSLNEVEYDCEYEDGPSELVTPYNVKINATDNIDVTLRRFRQIARYEVVSYPDVLFEKSSLLGVQIKAYDVNGKVVPILNKLESQWSLDGYNATFTPILPYNFDSMTTSRADWYVDLYVKAIEAEGVSLTIDVKNKSVVTSINDVKSAAPRVTAIDGGIAISGCDDCGVDVYSIDGKKVYSGHDSQVCLPGGIYIVRVDGKAVKVVVK